MVVFRPERGGLGDLLLDSFLLLQNPKTSHDRELLRKVMMGEGRDGKGGAQRRGEKGGALGREGRGLEERRDGRGS